MARAQTANKDCCQHFVFFRIFLCHLYARPRVRSAWTYVCFANNKILNFVDQSTSRIFKVA